MDIVAKNVKEVKKHRCWRGNDCEIADINQTEEFDRVVYCDLCQESAGPGVSEAEAAAEWKRIVEASNKTQPPDLIFLQFDDDIPDTFRIDKINDNDVEYVRLDMVRIQLVSAVKMLRQLLKPLEAAEEAFQGRMTLTEMWVDVTDLRALLAALEGAEGVGDETV